MRHVSVSFKCIVKVYLFETHKKKGELQEFSHEGKNMKKISPFIFTQLKETTEIKKGLVGKMTNPQSLPHALQNLITTPYYLF